MDAKAKELAKEKESKELVDKVLAGLRDAINDFYDKYIGLIYDAVYRAREDCRCKSMITQEDIKDIVQEVWIKLLKDGWRRLRDWDPKRASLSTFLWVIAYRTAIDEIRKRIRDRKIF